MSGGPFAEDFTPGERFRHARGRTVGRFDGATMAQLVMNTSDGHFDDAGMADTEWGASLVFGGLTLAMVVGLTMQDTGEHAIAELGLDEVGFRAPVRHGDSLRAYTEVLAVEPDGAVAFRHWGLNQHGDVVVECVRRVLLPTREAAR